MKLQQNLLKNYKESNVLKCQEEIKDMLLKRDNEIYKLYQQKLKLKGYTLTTKQKKTIKTEFGNITVTRRRYDLLQSLFTDVTNNLVLQKSLERKIIGM